MTQKVHSEDHSKSLATSQESSNYKQMLEDLENLVRDISSTDMDLDEMVQRIEHGYGLIKTMRTRLDETKEKIDKLREEYE